jgi:hypothetical protein
VRRRECGGKRRVGVETDDRRQRGRFCMEGSTVEIRAPVCSQQLLGRGLDTRKTAVKHKTHRDHSQRPKEEM